MCNGVDAPQHWILKHNGKQLRLSLEPPDKPAWAGAKTAPLVSLGLATVGSPSSSRDSVLTVDEACTLIQSTTDTLEMNQREAVAICGKLFKPLQQFMPHGYLVKELTDHKEIANLKVTSLTFRGRISDLPSR